MLMYLYFTWPEASKGTEFSAALGLYLKPPSSYLLQDVILTRHWFCPSSVKIHDAVFGIFKSLNIIFSVEYSHAHLCVS